jgi:cytochrome c oxidase accessory protein FixG
VDLPTRSLLVFGWTIRLEQFYLFLLLVITAALTVLLLTLVFGRVWCGWSCPQTTLSDLVEAVGRRLGANRAQAPRPRVLALHLFCALLAVLVAANLTWYFVSPYEFFPRLWAAELAPGIAGTLLVLAAALYLDLAFVRRTFCRTVCPYGRIQTALVDPGTLTLRVDPAEAHRCIECGACVRSCPTGVDIRRGYQVECINCGRCMDACNRALAKKGQAGIVGYAFGTEGRGARALLNPRLGLVALAAVAVGTALVLTSAAQAPVQLNVRRTAAPVRALGNGDRAVFYTGQLSNRDIEERLLSLRARTEDGTPLEVRGQTSRLRLPAGDRTRIDFALVAPATADRQDLPAILEVLDAAGRPIASATVTVPAAERRSDDR